MTRPGNCRCRAPMLLSVAAFAGIVCVFAAATRVLADTPASDAARVSAAVDAVFAQAWEDAGIEPAPLADDGMFLRRVYLDLLGGIPEIGEVREFLADTQPDKRRRIIEALLERPEHARHLANVWRDVLLPRRVDPNTSQSFEQWLQTQFRDGLPYDELVRRILLAQGSLGGSPPVLYYAALDTKPSELAASTSQVFLGIQIRCAECHDHPFAAWKQDDFWSYAAFFGQLNGPAEMNGADLTDQPTGEVLHPTTQAAVAPRLLSDQEVVIPAEQTRREFLAEWLTDKSNPYFARATVNRVWSLCFGRGLVQPVDDFDDQRNPPSHPEVLAILAEDFVAHDFDLSRVFRIIAGTQAYQRTSSAETDEARLRAYAVMPVRSLAPKQVYESMVRAAGRRIAVEGDEARLASQRLDFITQIDAPTRQATEFQGGIPQTLTMLNGPLVDELTSPWSSDLIAALADSPFLSDAERIDTIFLATLTRFPTPEQRARTLAWIQQGPAEHSAQAYSDLLWALLNSTDFVLNR